MCVEFRALEGIASHIEDDAEVAHIAPHGFGQGDRSMKQFSLGERVLIYLECAHFLQVQLAKQEASASHVCWCLLAARNVPASSGRAREADNVLFGFAHHLESNYATEDVLVEVEEGLWLDHVGDEGNVCVLKQIC